MSRRGRSRLGRTAFVFMLLLAGGGAPSGCGAPTPADDQVGVAQFALAAVPADVRCILIAAAGTRSLAREFNASPGSAASLEFPGLPLGLVTFTASAFSDRCGTSTPNREPSWISDPTGATIEAKVVARLQLVMHRNGRAIVEIDFQEDPACTPPGTPCGNCCPGLTCDQATNLCAECLPDGMACDGGQLCCSGLACLTGICGQVPSCVGPGAFCDGTSPCCDGASCIGNVCGGCIADGADCDAVMPCCDGAGCNDQGQCGPPTCVPEGEACDDAAPCCVGTTCASGRCVQMCAGFRYSCSPATPCCAGYSCIDNLCVLPGPSCMPAGAMCDPTHPCCGGVACTNGLCGAACRRIDSSCDATHPCCDHGELSSPRHSGQCVDGICRSVTGCKPEGTSCGPGAPCCSGICGLVYPGVCHQPGCSPVLQGAAVSLSADAPACHIGPQGCCGEYQCMINGCTEVIGCLLKGGKCVRDGSCCSGLCLGESCF